MLGFRKFKSQYLRYSYEHGSFYRRVENAVALGYGRCSLSGRARRLLVVSVRYGF